MKKRILVLPGDGIGVEVTKVAMDVLEHICRLNGVEIQSEYHLIGGASLDAHDTPIQDHVIDAANQHTLSYWVQLVDPNGIRIRQINVLRKHYYGFEKNWVFSTIYVRLRSIPH